MKFVCLVLYDILFGGIVKKLFTILLVFLALQAISFAQEYFPIDATPTFSKYLVDKMKYKISDKVEEILKNKVSKLQVCDTLKIYGHTDTIGKKDYNLILSRKRAESVKTWLISNHIKSPILLVDWKGETELKNPNSNYENRRVEIFSIKRKNEFPEKEKQLYTINNSKISYGWRIS